MISSAMEITCTSEFFQWRQNCVLEKLTSACYFYIAREIMLLLVNNIKGNVWDKNTRNTTTYHAIQLLTTQSLRFTFSIKKTLKGGVIFHAYFLFFSSCLFKTSYGFILIKTFKLHLPFFIFRDNKSRRNCCHYNVYIPPRSLHFPML